MNNKVNSFFLSNGYAVNVSDFEYNKIKYCKQISAIKGKIFKKSVLVFYFPSVPDKNMDSLVEFIKKNNKNNNLCLVLCDNCVEINDLYSKTFFTYSIGDSIGIIHFVYFSVKYNKYIYDLNFSYHNSKIIKDLINFVTKEDDSLSNVRTRDVPLSGDNFNS